MWTICNVYKTHLYVSIMFYSPETCSEESGNFETMGWWSLAPGGCANVYANDLEDVNRYWLYYAEADDGTKWTGPYNAMVNNQAFDGCVNIGVSTWRNVGFRLLDVGDNDDYTLTLTP